MLKDLYNIGSGFIPLFIGLTVTLGFIWLLDFILLRRHRKSINSSILPGKLIIFFVFLAILFEVLVLLPVSDELRLQIMSLLGIVLTAVIAVSSTTFVSNAMAGIMLRMVRSFRPGDFLKVGEKFGKVSELGLFHTEIQTEDRDLSTLPNMQLVTQPVTVVHRAGTIVSAVVSLGYDEPCEKIEDLLKQSVVEAGLSDPFVLVKSLGDFSVTYQASGFYQEVKQLLTVRSDLHKSILKILHQSGVEIVSPAFMNQRRLPLNQPIIPLAENGPGVNKKIGENTVNEAFPEDIMFDKAHQAEYIESLKDRRVEILEKIKTLNEEKNSEKKSDGALIGMKIASLENQVRYLDRHIEIQSSEFPD